MNTRSKNRFMVTSIIIAIAMATVSLGVIVGPLTRNASASITGDTYSGSGDFTLTQNTVYDGTDLHVYGDIHITGFSLTVRSATLTMDLASIGAHSIWVNNTGVAGTFKLAHATLTTSNSSAGLVWVNVWGQENAHIYVSNSTANHIAFRSWASGNYFDNSTFHASRISSIWGETKTRLNISTNTFQDYNGWGLISSSMDGTVVTGNTFTNITQTEDPGYDYSSMVTLIGDGSTGNVSIIKNHFVNVEIGAIKIRECWNVHVSRNQIDRLTTTGAGAAETIGIIGWGDGKHAALPAWGMIDNNTLRLLEGATLHYGTTGIQICQSGGHWIVSDNHIWTMTKVSLGYQAIGVFVAQGSTNVLIVRNDFGNVTATIDDGGGQSKAVSVHGGGDFDGPATTRDVKVMHNTIDDVYSSALGIEVRYMASDIEVSNNTIGLVRGYDSSGIGVYNGATDVLIADNTLTMWRDVWGINLAHNHTYATVNRNTIHVLAQAHFHDEGAYAGVRGGGAIAVNDEADGVYLPGELHWTAIGDVYANNVITHESTAEYFPDYTLLNLSHQMTIGPPGEWLRIILNQDAMIYSWHSNYSVEGSGDQLPIILRSGSNASVTVSGAMWDVDFTDSEDFYFTNVSLTPLGVAADDSVLITVDHYAPSATVLIRWNATSTMPSTTTTFTLSGLENNTMYDVVVNGTLYRTVVSNDSGVIQFTYDLTTAGTLFEVEVGYMQRMLDILWPLIIVAIIVSLVAVVIGGVGSKKR
jgi:hypothetical protein